MSVLGLLRRILVSVAVLAGAVLAARMFIGPFRLIWPVNAPLNPESFFGVAATILLIASPRSPEGRRRPRSWSDIALAAAVVLAAVVALRRSLTFYFLSDDFATVKLAAGRPDLAFHFAKPGGDGFFRPIGSLSLVADSAWAGFDPRLWHLSVLALHAFNCILVFRLALEFCRSRFAAFFAAALFAIHGTRPEAAVWIAGRFDLLATTFVLAGLLLFLRSCVKPGEAAPWRAGALLATALGIATKELAYVFPLLVIALIAARRDLPGAHFRASIPFFAVAAALFAWRWFLFGGIGGYRVAETGEPQALALGVGSLKALGMRLWATLYFPINWSAEPGPVLAALVCASMAGVLWLALKSRAGGRLWFPLAFIVIACLPPLHLLVIGPDLGNSRILYLPSVGFCLLLAMAIETLESLRLRVAVAGALLAFHFAALAHNLDSWEHASEATRSACAAAAAHERPDMKLAAVGLPRKIRGVPSFANGFGECVEIVNRRPAAVEVDRGRDPGRFDEKTVVLIWDEARERLVCARRCN